MFQTVFIDAHPIIGDREFKMSIAILIRNVFQAYGNFSSIITILKGIGEQIGNHLVKLRPVNPSLQTFQPFMVECETYVTLPSREIKHSTDDNTLKTKNLSFSISLKNLNPFRG